MGVLRWRTPILIFTFTQRMISMRKNLTIFCIVALGLFWVGAAFAVNNTNAYFKLDVNLTTTGYQEGTPVVTGIEGQKQVGFAIYSQAWDNSKGFTVKFEWDSTKAEFRATKSGAAIIDDSIDINGVTITPPAENNILFGTGGSIASAAETNQPGLYTNSFYLQGGTASTTAVGLVYLAVLRTLTTFKTTDLLTVKASVTVSDENGVEKFLGYRYFNVNSVGVENSTWGSVKEKFKDF